MAEIPSFKQGSQGFEAWIDEHIFFYIVFALSITITIYVAVRLRYVESKTRTLFPVFLLWVSTALIRNMKDADAIMWIITIWQCLLFLMTYVQATFFVIEEPKHNTGSFLLTHYLSVVV